MSEAGEMEQKIKDSLVNGKLLCPVAFEIARELGVTPLEVGDKANELDIKIAGCQLGCFP